MTAAAGRIAGAPISWGVCEAPGWGYQLAAGHVLAEMSALGIKSCEFGPGGFLPADPAACVALLDRYGLTALGGFLPVVAHREDIDPLPVLEAVLARYAACGAGVVVLAAITGADGYDARPDLSAADWTNLLANLDLLAGRAAEAGLTAVLHPHVGTLIERAEEVDRVLAGSSIQLCLDTGHLLVGGADVTALARRAGSRIGHVHLKDADAALAGQVRTGRLDYSRAVRGGLFTVLGQGDADIAGTVRALEDVGYRGHYVLEQDVMLDAAPDAGAGPVRDVADCFDYVTELLT